MENSLKLPVNCIALTDDEMTYTEGGSWLQEFGESLLSSVGQLATIVGAAAVVVVGTVGVNSALKLVFPNNSVSNLIDNILGTALWFVGINVGSSSTS